MKTVKMSLANLQGKMSRNEMRNIMAGSGTCCVTAVGNVSTVRYCGLSKQEAIAEATFVAQYGSRGYWCCASC